MTHRAYALLCLGAIFLACTTPGSIAQSASINPKLPTSHALTDSRLLKAKGPSASRADIETAVDSIFSLTGLDPNLAAAFSVRSRVVDSEIAYRQGRQSSVTEANVERAVNRLSRRWRLPVYTLTSHNEVRKLHVAMSFLFPQFLLTGLPQRTASQGPQEVVRSNMSPLEGTLLFSMLIHQKLINPEFQLNSTEYEAAWRTRHSGKPAAKHEDRSVALAQSIRAAAKTGSLRDLLAQADDTMADLGFAGGAR